MSDLYPIETFETVEAERANIRAQIVVTLRLFADLGFEWGTAGHLTVKDPGDNDHYWVNPQSVSYRLTGTSDLVLVDATGGIVDGKHPIAGFSSQYQVHIASPENRAVAHVHSPYGFMWSSKPALLEPLDDDSASIHGLQAIALDLSEDAGAHLSGAARILIRKSHGFMTTGGTIGEAAFYLMAAERAAKAQLILDVHGKKGFVEEPWLSRWQMSPAMSAFEFKPHADYILATQPELIDD